MESLAFFSREHCTLHTHMHVYIHFTYPWGFSEKYFQKLKIERREIKHKKKIKIQEDRLITRKYLMMKLLILSLDSYASCVL